MDSVFISYRREDSAAYAGRLFDHLSARFGEDRVFFDVDTIRAGEDFVQVIEEKVGSSGVLVAVIGKNWQPAELLDPGDFVRREILTALKRQVRILPVLVGGAVMPQESDLPPELAPLARRHALELRDNRFVEDLDDLIRAIGQEKQGPAEPPETGADRPPPRHGGKWWVLLAATLAACLLAFWVYDRSSPRLDPAWLQGRWEARVLSQGGAAYPIEFTFEVMGRQFGGTVQYPTGRGGILEGSIEDEGISFKTEHLPQFEREQATIRFTGKRVGGQIEFLMTTEHGSTRFLAEKKAR